MTRVTVGRGSCGIASGADAVLAALRKEGTEAVSVGCVGLCFLEPIVEVFKDGLRHTFVNVNELFTAEYAKYTKGKRNIAEKFLIKQEDSVFLENNGRIVLKNCGLIDPENIDEYGNYEALAKAKLQPSEAVIETIKASGLLGRGGAGFPTWFKWDAAGNSPGVKKYIICNADEGDPGAFMDRAILEGDPHAVLEGMLIAAHAIGGADSEVECIIYVRAEYPLAVKRLETAISQAKEKGLTGDVPISIKEGAGAFVCGEETALIASLEGERGMPRFKPPFPARKGLWGFPTNINNVETFANVPYIILNGAEAFNTIGTENSKGTKVFALAGKIEKGGLAEIPMGTTLREVIDNNGGGVRGGKKFKAVQLGGPSGGCIPESLLDTAIDYKALAATGAIMGSGGMVVMDGDTCMVEMARFFLDFVCKESCGKCTHCRVGTKRMLEILTRIASGEGREGDAELLCELGEQLREGSLCQLGMTAPNPVLTAIRYFRDEFDGHILHKKCAALSCAALISYAIDAKKCAGCTACARICPASAISGEARGVHTLDAAKCVKCGKCAAVCKFGAVVVS